MRYLALILFVLLTLGASPEPKKYCGEVTFSAPTKTVHVELIDTGSAKFLEVCSDSACTRIVLKEDIE